MSTLARVIVLAGVTLAIIAALTAACGEPEEVLTDATPTATPRAYPLYIPDPDETPPISPYPVYPEFSFTPPPETPLWELSTPTPPTSVTVLGRVIPVPPGAEVADVLGECAPAEALPTGVRCSPHFRQIVLGTSVVSWDEYGILSTAVKSSDEADFRATLDELAKVQWKPLPAED
jgi:hypothetical protein